MSQAFYGFVTTGTASKSKLAPYITMKGCLSSKPVLRIGVHMGEVIRFVPKAERERARLVREARAIYDSIFPPDEPLSERQDKAPVSHTAGGARAWRGEGDLLS
jgi:hypothetical protein